MSQQGMGEETEMKLCWPTVDTAIHSSVRARGRPTAELVDRLLALLQSVPPLDQLDNFIS